MESTRIAAFLLAGSALAATAAAHRRDLPETPAALVAVAVEIDGRPAGLFPAPDGSDRYYVEAREGARYAVRLANRTGERVGVTLVVDGLNAISGQRDAGRGRMYVLDPWQRATIRGWRTSLEEVRRFTFVDERASYAARSGKANDKMGWIEVAVYRERRALLRTPSRPDPAAQDAAEATAPALEGARARSYPGTGWGRRERDPVVLVDFDPEASPSERTTLRYEYRPALVALGVLPPRGGSRDRLWERERGEGGFAPPPPW